MAEARPRQDTGAPRREAATSRPPETAPGVAATTPRRPSRLALLSSEVARLNRELDIARGEARRLAQLVEEDVLCGVLNRRGFERALRQALAFVWRHGTAATLLFVDLDGFKAINDSFGHAEGDRALQRVAERLQRQLRSSDVIARIGGDEFAVILWHASIDQARLKAATLEQAIAAGDNPVAVSIGVATLAGRDPSAVLDAADRDMYARKRERQAMMSGVSLSNR